MMASIEDKNLEIALKEYELATQHYFHEDKMKTDALKNSIIAVITIMSVATTIISTNYIKNSLIKTLFSLFLGFSGILISISYGIQYRRILKYQEARIDRLEKLQKFFKESNYFEIQIYQYDIKQREKPDVPKNKLISKIEVWLERRSSSTYFKILIPWVLILLWLIFLLVVVILYTTQIPISTVNNSIPYF